MFLNDPSGHQGGEQSRETSGRERPLGNPRVVASVGEGRGVGCGGLEEMSVMFIKWAELRDEQAVEVEERQSKAVAKSGGSTPPPPSLPMSLVAWGSGGEVWRTLQSLT